MCVCPRLKAARDWVSGPFKFREAVDNVRFYIQLRLERLDFAIARKITAQPSIMSDHDSDRSSPPPGYKMTRPCEEILQSLSDGSLTADEAAPRLAAFTVPDPNIDPEECEEHLQELWAVLLEFLGKAPGRVKMVADLILCIARLPPVLTESGEQLAVDDGVQRVWQGVPTLGWVLREEWNCECSRVSGLEPLSGGDVLTSRNHQSAYLTQTIPQIGKKPPKHSLRSMPWLQHFWLTTRSVSTIEALRYGPSEVPLSTLRVRHKTLRRIPGKAIF